MDRLEGVLQVIREFVAEREWQQFHDPKNLAMAIASEAAELLAEYRWVSNAEADGFTKPEGSAAESLPRQRIQGSRCCCSANALGLTSLTPS